MIVAIIGEPCSGKTTLLKKLSEKGYKVFHADSFIKKIYRRGEIGYKLIKENFGDEFVNDNSVNRNLLKKNIIMKKDFLHKLNNLIHPLIFDYLKDKDNFFAELPIINSSAINFKYDKLILVTASREEIQKRMLAKYNVEEQELYNFFKLKPNYKIQYDFVLDTTNGITFDDIKSMENIFNEK